jgi:hypothetical protein
MLSISPHSASAFTLEVGRTRLAVTRRCDPIIVELR